MSDKVRENRLRRMADRRGWDLRKSRRRDSGALDFGTYQLVEPSRNALVLGDSDLAGGFGMSLDQIEDFLNMPLPRRDMTAKLMAMAKKPRSRKD